MNGVIMKKCSGPCGLELELNEENFRKRKTSKDGFFKKCRKCICNNKPTKIIIRNGIQYQICTGECKSEKESNSNNFFWNKTNENYFPCCKICTKKQADLYRKENRKKYSHRKKNIEKKIKKKLKLAKLIIMKKIKKKYQ